MRIYLLFTITVLSACIGSPSSGSDGGTVTDMSEVDVRQDTHSEDVAVDTDAAVDVDTIEDASDDLACNACADQIGECAKGISECNGEASTCIFPPTAFANEIDDWVCDGLDNDCDGDVDENCCDDPFVGLPFNNQVTVGLRGPALVPFPGFDFIAVNVHQNKGFQFWKITGDEIDFAGEFGFPANESGQSGFAVVADDDVVRVYYMTTIEANLMFVEMTYDPATEQVVRATPFRLPMSSPVDIKAIKNGIATWVATTTTSPNSDENSLQLVRVRNGNGFDPSAEYLNVRSYDPQFASRVRTGLGRHGNSGVLLVDLTATRQPIVRSFESAAQTSVVFTSGLFAKGGANFTLMTNEDNGIVSLLFETPTDVVIESGSSLQMIPDMLATNSYGIEVDSDVNGASDDFLVFRVSDNATTVFSSTSVEPAVDAKPLARAANRGPGIGLARNGIKVGAVLIDDEGMKYFAFSQSGNAVLCSP